MQFYEILHQWKFPAVRIKVSEKLGIQSKEYALFGMEL